MWVCSVRCSITYAAEVSQLLDSALRPLQYIMAACIGGPGAVIRGYLAGIWHLQCVAACLSRLGEDIGVLSRWDCCGSAAYGALSLVLLRSASRLNGAAFAVYCCVHRWPGCGHWGLSRWDCCWSAACGALSLTLLGSASRFSLAALAVCGCVPRLCCGSAAYGALTLMLLGSASRFSVAAFAVCG